MNLIKQKDYIKNNVNILSIEKKTQLYNSIRNCANNSKAIRDSNKNDKIFIDLDLIDDKTIYYIYNVIVEYKKNIII